MNVDLKEKIYKPTRSVNINNSSHNRAKPVCVFKNNRASVYRLTVPSKQWCGHHPLVKELNVVLPSITNEVLDFGKVLVFLEGVNRHLALPFVYYQLKRGITINAKSHPRRLHLSLHGQFIMNVSLSFTFHVVVVHTIRIAGIQGINWGSFEQVCMAYKIAGKDVTGSHKVSHVA